MKLSLFWCANRASACARTTFNAISFVDFVNAAIFHDAVGRTFCSTSTTTDAAAVNLVCHWDTPPLFLLLLYFILKSAFMQWETQKNIVNLL